VYCEPWSEWWITPFGRSIASAMFKASSTNDCQVEKAGPVGM
jgi:hypothetical protein